MMFPYADFLIEFDRKHGGTVHRNAPENRKAAVIIESRPLYFLPKVIRNTMFFLGPAWNLHVITAESSYDFAKACLPGWEVRVQKINGLHQLTIADYNRILTDRKFWGMFPEERLLLFQSDSLLSGDNVEDFAAFDYVGAPCGQFDETYTANGGLSLRSRALMIECLARFKPAAGVAEDIFFTQAERRPGAAMPDFETATRFAVETVYTAHPFGVHGTDKCFHSVETAQQITGAIQF